MTRFRLPLAIFLVLVVQRTVFVDIVIADVQPDGLLLLAIVAGIVAGSEWGAIIAFVCGILTDLFVQTPFGLSALTYALVAFAVGTLQSGVIRSAWWITPATAVVASTFGVLLYGVAGTVIGQSHFVTPDIMVGAIVIAAVNGLLAVPAAQLMRWATAGLEPERGFAR